ncbi:MAG: hypothetical protein LBV72_12225 [Tannerella sp.]|nr:hypothetical protein [Tannerella sp.]
MIKRLLLIFFTCVTALRASACGYYYEPDYEYYNLFMQELIDDPQYFPFLRTSDLRYYNANGHQFVNKNENIEEWEHYLGLTYEQTYYLVFKAGMEDVEALIEGKKAADEKLDFITPSFVKKYKAALRYLVYAKSLEPYMKITESENNWYSSDIDVSYTADQLDYEMVIDELKLGWKQVKDKELKLRYGYQLVRFAHYNRCYEDAVAFFDEYVESLTYKPAMYYHALSQLAGAQRGLGDTEVAIWNFFHVFIHSRDLKTSALSSISFNENVDFNTFFDKAQTQNEVNNIYLLLGYYSFNNPLNEAEKILVASPDAIQGKVLVARAINQIEREIMPVYYWRNPNVGTEAIDKRYPVIDDGKINDFFQQLLGLVDRMATSTAITDKNYWFITAAYLNFLKKDFVIAQQMLDRVNTNDELYLRQKQYLAMYIDICKHPQITSAVESDLFRKYPEMLKLDLPTDFYSGNVIHSVYSTKAFILDVLANRYYLQQDYAKSFLLSNKLTVLENNPQLMLINAIDSFYNQPNKNKWEDYLLSVSMAGVEDVEGYLEYLSGIVYLTHGELDKAADSFAKTNYNKSFLLPLMIFGYNRIECFDCPDTMEEDYLSEFSFINEMMNFEELVDALIALDKIGQSKNGRAAKANYLLGNFFYNVSEGGYFRHVLRFDSDNGFYSERYQLYNKPDPGNQIYFKYYRSYYEDPSPIAQRYLENAYEKTSDKELKARIVFALSKCELLAYNISNNYYNIWRYSKGDGILISERRYFKELMQYRKTKFFDVVQSNCKYFDYYVSHCADK